MTIETIQPDPTRAAAEVAQAGRFNRNLFVRCPAILPSAVETAARRQCMTSSEYVRRSVVERLSADGIEVGDLTSPSAGTLYDVVAGKQRWAWIEDGKIRSVSYHDTKPDQEGRAWLPVVHVDSEPFDIVAHWRLAPVYSIEPNQVICTYPVVLKSLEHA